jgi:hypothetical protein
MIMNVQTPLGHSNRIPQRRLWFGACAGAAAWATDGFTCFLISTQACADGNGNWGSLSAAEVRLLLGVITLVLLAVAVIGGLMSLRNWRSLSEQRNLAEAEGQGREAFMALVGVFVSAAFVVGIIWAGIPLILIDVCINAR